MTYLRKIADQFEIRLTRVHATNARRIARRGAGAGRRGERLSRTWNQIQPLMVASIQERHRSHRPGAILRVHLNPMPAIEPNGGVVGVPDLAPNVNDRVAGHGSPTPLGGVRVGLQQLAILIHRQAVRMTAANVDRGAAVPVQLLTHVRLATTTLIGSLVRISFSLTCTSGAGMKNHSPWRTNTSVFRRSRFFRLPFFPCSRLRTASGFNASLAVTTVLTGAFSGTPATNQWRSSWPHRNLSLVSGRPGRSAGWRTINSRWRSLGCTSSTWTSASCVGLDVEELAVPVVADVDHDRTSRRSPAVAHQRADCGPGSELLEFGFK